MTFEEAFEIITIYSVVDGVLTKNNDEHYDEAYATINSLLTYALKDNAQYVMDRLTDPAYIHSENYEEIYDETEKLIQRLKSRKILTYEDIRRINGN